ncbi:multisubunit sodium/proton antiporter MrpB subunit [Novosphingobium sp. PhB165]|uniref:Na(+)/H(+) antiporter subunit B n=1 Tax=Novosphingobium sp. PhB165 TaxID=2485105 RepID=UPI0010DE696A|nr:Na(+)/H(+) antiporter subunit B [Novosphingobium sp. PhB165]TCM16017.1 multisubunit sodium/proton antiporter MrpB subunit [Novosphingobium sp. PhB165]
MTAWLDSAALILLIGLAAWVVLGRNTFAAVAGFIAYGMLLGLVWVELQGIDVAMTEAAIGGGLTGALMIGAARRLKSAAPVAPATAGTLVIAIGVGAAMAAILAACVLALPNPAPSLASLVAGNIAATGVQNPITAVLLAFRSMDTLLEAVVLLLALIAVWSLAPDAEWPGRIGVPQTANPNGILAYIARVLPPIGLVIGFYIFWAGADQPGGKFQAATILAAMWLLIISAGLGKTPPVSSRWLRAGLIAGPIGFILVGAYGVASTGAFLGLPAAYAKPLIVTIEIALLPTLTLILALLIPPPLRKRAEA